MSALAYGLIGYGCGAVAAIVFFVALCMASRRGDEMQARALDERRRRHAAERLAAHNAAPLTTAIDNVVPLRPRRNDGGGAA